VLLKLAEYVSLLVNESAACVISGFGNATAAHITNARIAAIRSRFESTAPPMVCTPSSDWF
jgi:hypothetical protein